jgi:hypothetical protein
MFLGHNEGAKALYLAHKGEPVPGADNKFWEEVIAKGEPVPGADNKLWEQVIADDFAKLRKAGLTSPMMADVEKELGISR